MYEMDFVVQFYVYSNVYTFFFFFHYGVL